MRRSLQYKTWNNNFNNQTIQKERVDHKVVWEEMQNEMPEGQIPAQNAGSWPLTKRGCCFIRTFWMFLCMYKFWPHHIVSVNESGFSDVQDSPPVIISRGLKNIEITTILGKLKHVKFCELQCTVGIIKHYWSPWNYLFAQNQDGWRKMWLSCDSNI